MNQFKTLGLLAGRSSFVVVSVITSAALFMVTCLDRLRRLLLPAIFNLLPEEYRRVIHLASGMPALVPIVWARFKPVRKACSRCHA
jgi:hypothetical protein